MKKRFILGLAFLSILSISTYHFYSRIATQHSEGTDQRHEENQRTKASSEVSPSRPTIEQGHIPSTQETGSISLALQAREQQLEAALNCLGAFSALDRAVSRGDQKAASRLKMRIQPGCDRSVQSTRLMFDAMLQLAKDGSSKTRLQFLTAPPTDDSFEESSELAGRYSAELPGLLASGSATRDPDALLLSVEFFSFCTVRLPVTSFWARGQYSFRPEDAVTASLEAQRLMGPPPEPYTALFASLQEYATTGKFVCPRK